MNMPLKNNSGLSGGISLEKDSFTGVGPDSAYAGGTVDEDGSNSLPMSSAMPVWKETLETNTKPYEKADPIALFNEKADALEKEILSNNSGSNSYNRQLAYNLKKLRDEATVKLSNYVVKNRRDKIELGWNDDINRYVRFESKGDIAEDIRNITSLAQQRLFSQDDDGRMVPFFGENDTREKVRSAVNELYENQFTRLLNRNDLEGAQALLDNPLTSKILEDKTYKEVRDSIATRRKEILKGETTETEYEKSIGRVRALTEIQKMFPNEDQASLLSLVGATPGGSSEILSAAGAIHKIMEEYGYSFSQALAVSGKSAPSVTALGPDTKAITPEGEVVAEGKSTPRLISPGQQVVTFDENDVATVVFNNPNKLTQYTLKEGEVLYSETGEEIARGPAPKPSRNTLGQGQVLVEGNKVIAEGPPSVTTLGPGQKAVTSSGEEIASVEYKPVVVGKGMQVIQFDEDGDMQVIHETSEKAIRTTLGENQVLVDENNNIIAEGPTPKSKVKQAIENVEQAEDFTKQNPNASPQAKQAVNKAAGIVPSSEELGKEDGKKKLALFEQVYGRGPKTPDEFDKAFTGGVKGGTNISITNEEKATNKFIETLSKNEADTASKAHTASIDARDQLVEIALLKERLTNGKFKPGPAAGFRLYMGQVAHFFDIDTSNIPAIGDPKSGEAFQAGIARLATEASKNTTRIRLAFEFIQRSMPELSKTKEGNLLILEVMERIANRRIEIGNLLPEYKKHGGLMPMDGFPSFSTKVGQLEKDNPIIDENLKKLMNAEVKNGKELNWKDLWSSGGGEEPKTPSGPDFSNDSDENLNVLLEKAKERNRPEAVEALETEIASRKKKNQNPLEAFRNENNIEVTEGKGEGFAEVLFAGNDGKGRNIIEFRKAGNFKKQDIIDAETLHFMGGSKEDGTPYHEEFFDLKQQFINAMPEDSKKFAERKFAQAKKKGMTGTNFSNFENYIQNVWSDLELRGAMFPQLMTDRKERKLFKSRKLFTPEQKAILKQMDKIVKGG